RDRLIAILEATPDFVSTARPDGQVLYYNQAARRILGIDADADVTGFKIPAGQPEWAGTRVEEEGIPAAIRDGIWQGHTALVNAAGVEIPASQIILAHGGTMGEVEYLSTIARDVSREHEMLAEVQQAWQQAEEQAALLDTMLASLAEAVILYGPDAHIVRANPAARALFPMQRRPPANTLAEHVPWLTPVYENGEPIPYDQLPAVRALRGEVVRGLIVGIELPSRPLLWLSSSAAPVYGPGGDLLGAVSSLVDITELRRARDELEQRVQERTADLWKSNQALQSENSVRRQIEAELRESELRFRQLAENVDEFFLLWDAGTRQVLYASPSYEALWGRSVAEVYEHPGAVLEGVHPDDRDRMRVMWEDSSKNHDLEFRVLRPDNSVRWVRGRTFFVEGEPGMAPRIAAIAGDITGQKEAQAAMIRADRLATTIKLATSLAHEINNPLQSAIGCLDLALETIDGGKDPRRFLDVVCEALVRAAGVVGQLRSLHRHLDVEERHPVELGDLLEQVMVQSRNKWQSQGVEVILTLDPDL
ncbi:MAG TPA: PAS domain S-box protein, partial [Anaerolineae bacterium]|nr:PAS domain S-box protein [Anaerolineae bacterium]